MRCLYHMASFMQQAVILGGADAGDPRNHKGWLVQYGIQRLLGTMALECNRQTYQVG